MDRFIVFTDFDLDGAGCYLTYKWFNSDKTTDVIPLKVTNLREKILSWLNSNSFETYKQIYFFDIDTTAVADLIDRPNVTIIDHHETHTHKYKQENGKAFSYFSIIAKNFLILYNNGNYKKFKRHMSVDDDEIVYERKELTVNPKNEVKRKEVNEFINLMIDYYDTNLEKMFKKPQELKIAAAVIEIFRRCDSIENFNKKAIYLYKRHLLRTLV